MNGLTHREIAIEKAASLLRDEGYKIVLVGNLRNTTTNEYREIYEIVKI